MIKDIFVPEQVGAYYVFPKRIIGFDIGKSSVHATQVYLYRRKVVIEKFFEEKIEANGNLTYQERTAEAIKAIMARAGQCQAIHTAISSSVVVFKELTVPFLETEKIRMMLNFEIEPMLPFPLQSAVIDFIITKQDLEQKRSDILVAAVQKEQIEQHLQLFAGAGISPTVVTVDLFALYGLYMRIPEYAQETGDVALIDLGVHATRIAYVSNRQLKFIRVLPKGLLFIAKRLSDEVGIAPAEAMEYILRFGLEATDDQRRSNALTKIFADFWNEVGFTLRAFANQTGQQTLAMLLLLGPGSEIKDSCSFVATLQTLSCKLFSVASLLRNSQVIISHATTVPRMQIISLSTAFPSPIVEKFNLRRGEFAVSDIGLFKKQLAVAGILMLLVFGIMIGFMYWQLHSLHVAYDDSEEEAIITLKEKFPDVQEGSLDEVIKDAENKLKQEQRVIDLSSPDRPSYLMVLYALSDRVGDPMFGFVPQKIIMEENMMTIDGSVNGGVTPDGQKIAPWEALEKFDNALRKAEVNKKKLFEFERISTPDFTVDIKLLPV